MKTESLAYAAVSAALGAMFMSLGFVTHMVDLFWHFLGATAVMIPLKKNYYGAAALSCLSMCLLTLLVTGINFYYILPFAIFMGWHPIVSVWAAGRVKPPVRAAVLIVWFDAAVYVILRFTSITLLRLDLNLDSPLTIIILSAAMSPLALLYDRGMRHIQRKINKL